MFIAYDSKRSPSNSETHVTTPSKLNYFVVDDDNTDKLINEEDPQQLVYEIADGIFDHEDGRYFETSSQDSAANPSCSSQYSVDKRLQYWKDVLRERRALQEKLRLATGKLPQDILFNRISSIDNREKETMKRVLEHAKISSTGPSMQKGQAFEFVGMPQHTITEMMGEEKDQGATKNPWLQSQALDHHLRKQIPHIKRVLNCPPDFEKLQVVGTKSTFSRAGELFSLHSISSQSEESCPELQQFFSVQSYASRASKGKTAGLYINGTLYKDVGAENAPFVERLFCCNPFERLLRPVLRFENNGNKVFSLCWLRQEFFAYNGTLMDTLDDEFVMDTEPFMLRPGEVRLVRVLFQPRKVCIVKQKWLLLIGRRIKNRRLSGFNLYLHGRCTPPEEYTQILDQKIAVVSNLVQKNIKRNCKRFVPTPRTFPCLYHRQVKPEERQMFNECNKGYYCKSYDDLEILKQIFNSVNNSSAAPKWDLSAQTLIASICDLPDLDQRMAYFEELQLVLARMRTCATDNQYNDDGLQLLERKLSRYIYVRGLISNAIEVWESHIFALEGKLFKLALQRQSLHTVIEEEEKLMSFSDLRDMIRNGFSKAVQWEGSAEMNAKTRKKVTHSKYFKDTIYIYTYTKLCSVAEDIVSVIESTEVW
ncbi:uncharacterized protein LOC115633769 [Scaptodrosophila lebanonensis]|uniref:Uncharacterized protein LOC115633769 n=1 Tax=Drosophila lebanonensis TaxID=7225 RepID=A0A6J2UFB3_DROLE|nr:uncharacterized protein LOC115633769 [Scaptodrosophila lebanonensis]